MSPTQIDFEFFIELFNRRIRCVKEPLDIYLSVAVCIKACTFQCDDSCSVFEIQAVSLSNFEVVLKTCPDGMRIGGGKLNQTILYMINRKNFLMLLIFVVFSKRDRESEFNLKSMEELK